MNRMKKDMSAVGFEPTSANTLELESNPLDRSGTLTYIFIFPLTHTPLETTNSFTILPNTFICCTLWRIRLLTIISTHTYTHITAYRHQQLSRYTLDILTFPATLLTPHFHTPHFHTPPICHHCCISVHTLYLSYALTPLHDTIQITPSMWWMLETVQWSQVNQSVLRMIIVQIIDICRWSS